MKKILFYLKILFFCIVSEQKKHLINNNCFFFLLTSFQVALASPLQNKNKKQKKKQTNKHINKENPNKAFPLSFTFPLSLSFTHSHTLSDSLSHALSLIPHPRAVIESPRMTCSAIDRGWCTRARSRKNNKFF